MDNQQLPSFSEAVNMSKQGQQFDLRAKKLKPKKKGKGKKTKSYGQAQISGRSKTQDSYKGSHLDSKMSKIEPILQSRQDLSQKSELDLNLKAKSAERVSRYINDFGPQDIAYFEVQKLFGLSYNPQRKGPTQQKKEVVFEQDQRIEIDAYKTLIFDLQQQSEERMNTKKESKPSPQKKDTESKKKPSPQEKDAESQQRPSPQKDNLITNIEIVQGSQDVIEINKEHMSTSSWRDQNYERVKEHTSDEVQVEHGPSPVEEAVPIEEAVQKEFMQHTDDQREDVPHLPVEKKAPINDIMLQPLDFNPNERNPSESALDSVDQEQEALIKMLIDKAYENSPRVNKSQELGQLDVKRFNCAQFAQMVEQKNIEHQSKLQKKLSKKRRSPDLRSSIDKIEQRASIDNTLNLQNQSFGLDQQEPSIIKRKSPKRNNNSNLKSQDSESRFIQAAKKNKKGKRNQAKIKSQDIQQNKKSVTHRNEAMTPDEGLHQGPNNVSMPQIVPLNESTQQDITMPSNLINNQNLGLNSSNLNQQSQSNLDASQGFEQKAKQTMDLNNLDYFETNQERQMQTGLMAPQTNDSGFVNTFDIQKSNLQQDVQEADKQTIEVEDQNMPIEDNQPPPALQRQNNMKSKEDLGSSESEEEQLSYTKLMKFIQDRHPVDPDTKKKFLPTDCITVKNFYLKLIDPFHFYDLVKYCLKLKNRIQNMTRIKKKPLERPESMSNLPLSPREDDTEGSDDEMGGLSKAAYHMGVGTILYLQTMKTLMVLFGLLTIINIPIYLIYSSATKNNIYDLQNFSQYFTLGQIGQDAPQCAHFTYEFDNLGDEGATHESLQLKCPGENQYITKIVNYGFLYYMDPRTQSPSTGQQQCEAIMNPKAANQDSRRRLNEQENESKGQNNTKFNVDSNCQAQSELLFSDGEARGQIQDYFDNNCYEKSDCVWSAESMNPRNFNGLFSEFCKENAQVIETSELPEGEGSVGEETEPAEEAQPIEERKDEEKVNPMTSNQFIFVYGCRSDYVMNHLTGKNEHKHHLAIHLVVMDIISCVVIFYIYKRLESINNEYIQTIDDKSVTMKDFAILCQNLKVDKCTQDSRLLKMKIWLHFTKLLKDINQIDSDSEGEQDNESLKALQRDDHTVVDVTVSTTTNPKNQLIFQMEINQMEINKIQSGLKNGEYKDDTKDQKEDELKELKDLYDAQVVSMSKIVMQESKTKVKKKKVQDASSSGQLDEIQFVFVTFKSTASAAMAVKFFQKQSQLQKLIQVLTCKKDKKEQDKEFLNHQLDVSEPFEPNQILWQNLSYSSGGSGFRKTISKIAAVVIGVFSILSAIALDGQRKYIEANFPELQCPQGPISPQAAYDDVISDNPKGLMPCFCQESFKRNPIGTAGQTFDQYNDEVEDKTKYCQEWTKEEGQSQTARALTATSVVMFNGFIAMVFKRLGEYQQKATSIEEQEESFTKIVSMEFLNTGLIILLVSFTGMSFQGEDTGVKGEKYSGFESEWYTNIGKLINVTLIVGFISSHTLDIKQWGQALKNRFQDRDKKFNLKKFPKVHPDVDDQPNTKLAKQEDLENLYLGAVYESEKALARMMSVCLVVLFYSSGIPILYAVGFVHFFSTFWLHKAMLMQYYQNTSQFKRQLPLFCVKICNLGFFLKLIAGIFMFNNPEVFEVRDKSNEQPLFSLDFNVSPESPLYPYLSLPHQQMYLSFVIAFIGSYMVGSFMLELLIILYDMIKHKGHKALAKVIQIFKQFIGKKAKTVGDEQAQKAEPKSKLFKYENEKKQIKEIVMSHGQNDNQEELKEGGDISLSQDAQIPRARNAGQDLEKGRFISEDVSNSAFQSNHQLISTSSLTYMQSNQPTKLLSQSDNDILKSFALKKSKDDFCDNFFEQVQIVYLESHFKRSFIEHKDFLKYFQLDDKDYGYQFYKCRNNHHLTLIDYNPYGFQEKGEEGEADKNQMEEITCKGCNAVIEDGQSFNHCFRCYCAEKDRFKKEDYCLKCNSLQYDTEVRFAQNSSAFEDDLNVLQEDFMKYLTKREGKSGRIIFNEQRDSHKPPEQVPKFDPKNPDTRSKFLERCYQSNVREWEVIYMDILLRKRIHAIHNQINKHFDEIKPEIVKRKDKKLARTIKAINGSNKSLNDKNMEIDIVKKSHAEDKDLKFDLLDHKRKLILLKDFQPKLIQMDIDKPQNRGKQTICRLANISAHSYFIFDSRRFKIAKDIFYNFKPVQIDEDSSSSDSN